MMKKIYTVLFLLFSITALHAQETTPTREPVTMEDMHIRADRNVGYGAESSFLVWHGYLNFEYDDKQGTNSNFDNHEFYLSARSDLNERVTLVAEFEYEHTPEKLILPIQAYGIYKFSDALMVRAGLFYTPIGMPRTYNLRAPRNRMIRQVALTHDIFYENWSEVGIEFMGELKNGFFYDVSITNGMPNTIRPGDYWFDAYQDLQNHSEDNNNNKALTGRFGYHARNFLGGEVNVAVAGVSQKIDPTNTRISRHVAADFRYVHPNGFRIQAEWARRSGDEHVEDLATYGVSMDATGWYAQCSKRCKPVQANPYLYYIEPVFQVDYIDTNTHLKNNKDLITYAPGVVFSPVQYYLIKLEYDFVQERYGSAIRNNMFWASIVVEF